MEKETVKAQLVAKEDGSMNYITYVFELLDSYDIDRHKSKYIMCVRYPNWDHAQIKIGDIGILNVIEVLAGIDKYYNGTTMLPYKYSNVQFIKFVPFSNKIDNKKITLD